MRCFFFVWFEAISIPTQKKTGTAWIPMARKRALKTHNREMDL